MAVTTTANLAHGVRVASAAPIANLAALTVLLLMRQKDVSNNAYHYASKIAGAGGWEIYRDFTDGTKFGVGFWKAAYGGRLSVANVLVANAWQWIAVSIDANGTGNANISLWAATGVQSPVFLDVTVAGSGPSGALGDDSSASVYFGNRPTENRSPPADLAEMVIYPAAATSGDELRQMVKGTFATAPALVWGAGLNGPSSVTDYSLNGGAGTIIGGTVSDSPRILPKVAFARSAFSHRHRVL